MFVDFLLSFAVMLCLMAVYDTEFTLRLVALPALCVLLMLTTLGFGLLVAGLNAIYRDFRYIIGFVLQIWMFASPIAYPLNVVPAEWQTLYSLNPVVGIVEGFRWALLGDPLRLDALGISVLVSLAALWLGARQFQRLERRLADLI